MIAKLKGKIESIYDDHFYFSGKTLSTLSSAEYSELLVEMHVREDHIYLYSFYNQEVKSIFYYPAISGRS